MNEYQKAADALKSLGQMATKVTLVGQMLERMGSYEQAQNEAQERINLLAREEGAARLRVTEIQNELEAIEKEARRIKDEAEDAARRIIKDASAEASSIVDVARQRAEEECAQALSRMTEEQRQAQARLDDVLNREAIAKAATAVHDDEIARKRAELEQLTASIAEAREAAKRLLSA